MATPEQLERALRNAHAAGDNAAARRIAEELNKSRGPSKADQNRANFDALPVWQKPIQALDDVLRIGSDAVTFGGVDYLREMFGTQPDVETARQATQEAVERAGAAAIPVQVGASMIPAMALPVVTAPASMGTVGGALFNSGMAALEGAGFAGLDALGHGRDVVPAQMQGAVMGVLSNAASKIMGASMDAIFDRAPQPSMGPRELRLAKERAYNAMEDEGVGFKPSAVDDLLSDLNKEKMYPGVNDAAIGARKRANQNLRQGGQGFRRNRSLSEIDYERQNIRNDVSSRPELSEKRQGERMVQTIDDWLERSVADPGAVSARSGDPQEALERLLEGRSLNQRVEKMNMIDERIGKARRQAERNLYSGEDSTLKSNIGGILDDPKRRAQFTAPEIKQMELVNKGTPFEQVLRQAGRMAPGGGLAWPSAVAAGTAGFYLGGPPAATALSTLPAAAGVLAKKASARSTRKQAEKLLDMVASGQTAIKVPHLNSKSQRELARVLMMMGLSGEED